jgi:membrane protease YdiL (CAAX protease family)
LPPNLISWHRLWSYFAFCLLQQVLLNSLVHNRMLSLVRRQWIAAILTGLIFAACHWPNPVLVPLTLIGGTAMAWMFGRQRNIIPLAVGQAILGSLIFWAFPLAWHHHLRVGPGYYSTSAH